MTDREEANLYRTRWLMAHNAIHDAAISHHQPGERFEEYLSELRTAEEVAKQPA